MTKPRRPSDKVLEFAVPQTTIGSQLEMWVTRIVESNAELAAALMRLRDSYCVLLAGRKAVRDDGEILAQVEAALQNAAKAKNVV